MQAADTLGDRIARLMSAVLGPESGTDVGLVARNRAIIRELKQFEDDAEDVSPVGRWLRPPTQYVLNALGAGNEEVYLGRTPWLFYRPDVDYLTGPAFLEPRQLRRRGAADGLRERLQPDPRPAILKMKAQLEARGIQLILMPTPVKPSIHPEAFAEGFEDRRKPLQSASYPAFIEELEQKGVLVFDPGPELVASEAPAYLMTDTHWRPEAMERVAARLRDFVTRHVDLPPLPPAGYAGTPVELRHSGDIARMLDLPEEQERFPAEAVRVREIRSSDRAPWKPDRSSDVLLLGDSFTNIYSLPEMGWGASAGLAEQLSFLLQRPLDRIARNADGAFATRELLERELAIGRDRLAGKRLVIFQFADRELAFGDWKLIDLELGATAPGRFFVPDPGDEVLVTGTIQEIAPIPRPGTVPYADHITAVHLVDLASERPGVAGGQAVVYIWGMRDHVLQPAAEFREGDRVSLRLRPWADVVDRYDGFSRTELANEEAQFEEPTWGEVVE